MCIETRKIIKSYDVMFVEDSTSVSDGLEINPSGSSEDPSLVFVDKTSKSMSLDDNDDGNSMKKEMLEAQEGGVSVAPSLTSISSGVGDIQVP